MSFFNAAILVGLVAVAIPPIIHLLNRRRYDVIDWGAMQFLQISEITRRRLLIEEILLMLLRMGLIGILVLAVADPYSDKWVAQTGGRPNRDVVLVIDGSASMSFGAPGETAQQKAVAWAEQFMKSLQAGDGVAVIVAGQEPKLLVPQPTTDLEFVRKILRGELPPMTGGCDWPRATREAYRILENARRGKRDIILLGDAQKTGLVDRRAVEAWRTWSERRQSFNGPKPSVWAVNVDSGRPEKPANWSLDPLSASRLIVAVNEQVTFRSAIRLNGQTDYVKPHKMKVRVNDEDVLTLDEQHEGRVDSGQVPVEFPYKFAKPGSYLMSLVVEPDPPEQGRSPKYKLKDLLPADNHRELVVEVVQAVPVLLVDGEDADAKKGASNFIRDNLSPDKDTSPAFGIHVVSFKDFDAKHLRSGLKDTRGRQMERPRVVVLDNVPSLTAEQQRPLEQFVKDGGGLLVTLGEKCDMESWNKLAAPGRGLLPAKLERVVGDDKLETAARPVLGVHPALEVFRNARIGGLDAAWFGRWWRVAQPDKTEDGVVLARLTRNDVPFLVEKPYGEGRVVLCTVPLDNSWRTNLLDLPAYVPLLQELAYYLAGTRTGEVNLLPGRPLRYRLAADATVEGYQLQSPSDAKPKPLTPGAVDVPDVYSARVVQSPHSSVLVHEGMNEPGVWKLFTPDKQTVHYVVQPDSHEFDLTPIGKEDQETLRKYVPISFEDDADKVHEKLPQKKEREEFWWWFLLGVVLLLCSEVWFTRKIVKGRV